MYIGVLFMFLDVCVVFGRDWMELGGNWNENEEIQKFWNLQQASVSGDRAQCKLAELSV